MPTRQKSIFNLRLICFLIAKEQQQTSGHHVQYNVVDQEDVF